MKTRILFGILAFFLAAATAKAESIPLTTAHGKVEKASKDTMTFQPRDEVGKFGKAPSVQITGTSKFWRLSSREKDKKVILVQKEADAKDLEAGQLVTVIYAIPKGQEPVLLSAAVQAEKEK